MLGGPGTPASEPSATSAHHHHVGRRSDDIYMSSATFWLESSSHSCLPRSQFTPYCTQWIVVIHVRLQGVLRRREGSSTAATPHTGSSFAAISVGSGIAMGAGTSTAVVRVWRVVHPGTASQAVVQKSATGAVQWFPNQEMMSHIIFFPAGLDNALTRPHHDTSTGITSTFCLNQSLYHLINQGHILNKPPHRHLARQLHPTSRSRLPRLCGGLLSA